MPKLCARTFEILRPEHTKKLFCVNLFIFINYRPCFLKIPLANFLLFISLKSVEILYLNKYLK